MSKTYDPAHWFWLADDGRIAGSSTGLVQADDAAYKTWTAGGGVATPWPKDAAGAQTDAALSDVLAPYGLSVGGAAPAAPVITFKADIYRRCTDSEAEAIEMALAAAPVRQRRLFESAQYLDHTDPVFATMHEAITGMFGAKRADVLLAAS